MNNTCGTNGRFGNHFFRNIIADGIARTNNLKFTYSYTEEFTRLGITLFSGENTYKQTIKVMNDNCFSLINESSNCSVDMSGDYFQFPASANYIRDFVKSDEQNQKIISANPYKNRYNNNNDIYLHLRLDDARLFAQPFEYFDNILQKTKFEKGFISSDSINDKICKKLIDKYKLTVLSGDIIDTIQFASTCKTIILSTGTFSWIIGILGFYSKIYFPIIKKKWHGDIFVFYDWNMIKW
jgi:hypothetical protein